MGTAPPDDDRALIRELTAQVGALLDRVAELERDRGVADPPPVVRTDRTVSRRGLLGQAGGVVAAGAGLAVGGSVLTALPAVAADGGAVVLGQTNTATSTTTINAGTSASCAFGDTLGGALAVTTTRTGSLGLRARGQASGIIGTGGSGSSGGVDAWGVLGSSSAFPGVLGSSDTSTGTVGQTQSGPYGVLGLEGGDIVGGGSLTLPPAGAGVAGAASTGPGVAGVAGKPGQTGVYGFSAAGVGVQALSTSSAALQAQSATGPAIVATVSDPSSTSIAVRGEAFGDAAGVLGVSRLPSDGIDQFPPSGVIGAGYSGNPGVFAYSDTGHALYAGVNNSNVSATVLATNAGPGGAVLAQVEGGGGHGVEGSTVGTGSGVLGRTSGAGSAVRGQVSVPTSFALAVYGVTAGRGVAVKGETTHPNSVAAGVMGLSRGKGAAVLGQVAVTSSTAVAVSATTAGTGSAMRVSATNTSSTAPALDVTHAGNAVGAQLAGTLAPLRLVPRSRTGAPTTGAHQVGELVVDSAGSLFVCRVAGTPGTWGRVTTT